MAAAVFKATWGSVTFDQLEGFRISTCFTPAVGFNGNFFIYLWDWRHADTPFKDKLGVTAKAEQNELTITDDADTTYTFPDITLRAIEMGVTRAMRYRLVEFQYVAQNTDRAGSVDVSLENGRTKVLKEGALEDAYQYQIEDCVEPLYGFRTRVAPTDSPIVRFSSLRNKQNGFLKKLYQVNKDQITGPMPSFSIGFSEKTLEVNSDNLLYFYTDESFGRFASLGLPSLREIADPDGDSSDLPRLARLKMDDFTQQKLLTHELRGVQPDHMNVDTIETATIVFAPNSFDDPLTLD